MATSNKEMTTKLTFRRYEDGDHKWKRFTEQIFVEDTSHKCPTYVHRTPPCQGSCPSGEDIRGWLNIVRGIEKPPADISMAEYAFRRSTDANPFPSMMGRVCPAPCQDGCNRNAVEDFVGINSIEQFIGDTAFKEKFTFDNSTPLNGKKVAIIGAGPAGMAAAYQLRRRGYSSTIFDEHKELGGMMRYGIPGYRTPRKVLDHECRRIIDMGGIDTRMNTRIGRDVSVETLEKDYDAILWSIGCQAGRALPVPNGDAPNCVTGVKFLEVFNKGDLKVTANRVVCIGGGDTSIDVVSVARRLGKVELEEEHRAEQVIGGYVAHDAAFAASREGAEVTLTSLFAHTEMTATEHEVHDALKEGVTILNGVAPIEVILGDDGRATALKMAECDVDPNGRPLPREGTEFEIECDLIVSAIGQGGDLEGLEEMNNGRGLINADKFYAVPDKPGHFVAGDIIRPHLLTTAIGQASIAAESIDHYLSHQKQPKRPKVDVHHFNLLDKLRENQLAPTDFEVEEQGDLRGTETSNWAIHNYEDRSAQEIIASDRLFLGHFEYTPRHLRQSYGPSSEDVLGHFEERSIGMTEEQAVAESERCISCGMCLECDNCVIFCPQDAVFRVKKDKSMTGRYVDTDYSRCIGCHICADVCPSGYINMALGDH